ncbi:cytochrome c biogenesis CcdA family protein [Cellulomonas sp. ES6]|uniref:cytochrome c biogenesis CcdA family protein n=1 Tax=Cellulomonas sp. ES6 TaxID=3039384 RepID=UPI0024B65695|nr:cytochrome c biogenesis CcdA family protein [Cellulomonas sp. ES6]WHP16494.1 cytochrome c biogenesis CcdA family protein [Cellulomonas sp. ES6]
MGSQLLTTGSVLAAFFAGGVALFAPCCIVFLAPSYLAGAVKNRRWRLLPLTFVFAAGLATVLLPITLGVSMVAGAIAKYHAPLYYAGGALMLALAALALSGRMWSLPSALRTPDTRRGDTGSFYALGVFSGIASSCCAPVLAGVMTLSALSGSPAGGLLLGLAYVFGMVFPLFVMALIWDKARLRDRRWMSPKLVRVRLAGWTLVTNSLNIAVAVGFTVMGVAVILLAGSPDMTRGTEAQAAIGRGLTTVFSRFEDWSSPIPEPVLGLGLVALAALFVWGTLSERRRSRTTSSPAAENTPEDTHEPHAAGENSCHGDHEGAAR